MLENIDVFVPNLIGYARVVIISAAFSRMTSSPYITCMLYILSVFLDEFDGYTASLLNQGSNYGAVLDMIIDRCATACLIMCLVHFYPKWMLLFQGIVTLDITSHWAHMYSSVLQGGRSHKFIGADSNSLLRLYYNSKNFLTFMCIGNEMFYLMLYLLAFGHGPSLNFFGTKVGLWTLLAMLFSPISLFKNIVNVIQLMAAFSKIATAEASARRA